jgi:formamidopyrimidine-DNA glycosylase
MPELPEVETVKRSLEPLVKGKTIQGVEILYGGIIKTPYPSEFIETLTGRTITDLERRGKYLLFFLDNNTTLVIHLRMTGRLTVCPREKSRDKHTHLIFHISPEMDLRFTDQRKFGLIYLVPTGNWTCIKGLNEIGYEPLSQEFDLKTLTKLLEGKKGKIKSFLLDQSKIAGIGNIYADEILFAAGIHPEREINTLDPKEIEALYHCIREKLEEGILYRGTSFRDYVDGRGEKGGFQEKLSVYGREGEQCTRCESPLKRIIVAGRGTVFCPNCQK